MSKLMTPVATCGRALASPWAVAVVLGLVALMAPRMAATVPALDRRPAAEADSPPRTRMIGPNDTIGTQPRPRTRVVRLIDEEMAQDGQVSQARTVSEIGRRNPASPLLPAALVGLLGVAYLVRTASQGSSRRRGRSSPGSRHTRSSHVASC